MATTNAVLANSPIGRDTPRVDGPRKVTGLAQYTSLASADTCEAAKAAADAVLATYTKEKPNVEARLEAGNDPDVVLTTYGPGPRMQSKRGDPEGAFASAPVKLDETYVTPAET